jgi:hypothetical protein
MFAWSFSFCGQSFFRVGSPLFLASPEGAEEALEMGFREVQLGYVGPLGAVLVVDEMQPLRG